MENASRTKPNLKQYHPGIGERCRALRSLLGDSQQQLAVKGGTTAGTIVELERRDLASGVTIVKVARGLGVSVAELLGQSTPAPAEIEHATGTETAS